MVFSSPIFLFLFLPIVLGVYLIIPKIFRNIFLLIASLSFYAWGEIDYFYIIIISIVFNYIFALLIDNKKLKKYTKPLLVMAIIGNLLMLVYFKYAMFILETLGLSDSNILHIQDVHLPIGISFFTFQALSYVIDVYRKKNSAQKNPIKLGLFISMFPQLIAGPIVRYHDINKQIDKRKIDLDLFTSGVRRFISGLGKKVLIANIVGQSADQIFALSSDILNTPLAWIGIICYSLQIFFDFSGYSDMAIGLGRMFGFRLLENFNYPYISKSIKEFWQRWHISLSNWLKDYLYIPLGGNRGSTYQTYLNLLIVFLLCGLWHGAGWSFIVWGLWYGIFLILERGWIGLILNKALAPVRHFYALMIIIIGWVFFRAETLTKAIEYLKNMFNFSFEGMIAYPPRLYLDNEIILALVIGFLISTPIIKKITEYCEQKNDWMSHIVTPLISKIFYIGILLLSIFSLAADTYNPFIYFRF